MVIKLGLAVAKIYGLTDSQFEYVRRLLGPQAMPPLFAKIAQFAVKYLSKEGLITAMRSAALRATGKGAARAFSRYIPVVGRVIASVVGWRVTVMLGNQLVDEAEGLAKEILEEIVKLSDLSDGD